MSVRAYQTQAEDAAFSWLNNTTSLGGVICQPTGVGKSHTQANILKRAFSYRPQARAMGLTHVKELIRQNGEKLKEAWPQAPLGIFSAGLNQKDLAMQITFGGVASVHKAIKELGTQDLLFIDEAHLLNPNADGLYMQIIDHLLDKNKYLRVIGLTATWWRLGLGSIIDGTIFQDVIINQTGVEWFNWFINQGYLTRLITRPTATQFDLSSVGVTGGDFNQTEAAKAFDQQAITYRALQEAAYYGHDRRKWIVFASGIDHAEHVCDMLNAMGVPTTVVHNRIPAKERDKRIADYKAGLYRCIVNNNVLTTGFDDAQIDLMIILRATMSPGLWVQMLGRGTRPYYVLGGYGPEILDTIEGRFWAMQMGGKLNTLVLDFAGNAQRLGPINDPVIPNKKGNRAGDPPIKLCKTEKLIQPTDGPRIQGCGNYNHPSAVNCEVCGAAFDFAVKFTDNSYTDDVLTSEGPIMDWFDVQHVFYDQKVGPSGKPYLRVTYWSGNKKFVDMVWLGQEGWLLHKAKQWWQTRWKGGGSGDQVVPPSVNEALPYTNRQWLKQPIRIMVHVNKKPYPEIVSYEYE